MPDPTSTDALLPPDKVLSELLEVRKCAPASFRCSCQIADPRQCRMCGARLVPGTAAGRLAVSSMPRPADLLERIDAIMAELAELRAKVAATGADEKGTDTVSTPADDLIDSTTASSRFGYSRDSIIRWCKQGCGRKVGGRWLADPARLRAHINGA